MQWTEKSNKTLEQLYSIENHSIEEIMQLLNRSKHSIHVRSHKLKLKRNPVLLKSIHKANSRTLVDWVNRNGAWNKKEKIPRTCKTCGDIFSEFPYKVNEGKGLYCSLECYNIDRHNPDFPLSQIIRHCQEYKDWLKAVFERDNYTCQKCEQWGGYLEGHHILKFSEHEEHRFNVSNGITLCYDCHREIHGKKKICDAPSRQKNPLIGCACGCGETFKKYDNHYRERIYKNGHSRRKPNGNMSVLR